MHSWMLSQSIKFISALQMLQAQSRDNKTGLCPIKPNKNNSITAQTYTNTTKAKNNTKALSTTSNIPSQFYRHRKENCVHYLVKYIVTTPKAPGGGDKNKILWQPHTIEWNLVFTIFQNLCPQSIICHVILVTEREDSSVIGSTNKDAHLGNI